MAFNLSTASTVKQRPTETLDWVRPADWISITSVPDNEIYYLVADMGLKTFRINTTFTRTASQNIYIDWGDGTTTTISTTTSTGSQKTYTTGGTPCSRGYNTYRIRIYGDAGTTITGAAFAQPTTYNRSNYPVYLLEAWYGNGVNIPMAGYFTSNGFNYTVLEYVKLPSTYLGTSFNSTFYNTTVKKVDMPTSAPNLTDIGYMFFQCFDIKSIVFPSNATGINGFDNTFNLCSSVEEIVLPTTLNSVTSAISMFSSCFSLKTIKLPNMPNCVNFANTFIGCRSLTFVEIPVLPSSGSINFIGTFSGCSALEAVKLPPITGTATLSSTSSMFNACSLLREFKFPSGWDSGSMATMFASCGALQRVDMLSSMPALTSLNGCFNGCTSLTDIKLPTTVSASGILLTTAFQNCYGLSKITIPSGWVITGSAAFMCNGCTNLIEFNFPATEQNGITALNAAFQTCNRLQVLTMPTSLNGCTTLQATFQNCWQLQTVTLPSAMNACTLINGMFNSCFTLRSVTMPTSMSACVTFTQAFLSCWALKSITMPATVSASTTTFANTFQNCFSLETVTLPTTQTTSLTSINAMFSACYSLITVNNTTNLGSTSTSGTIVDGTNFKANAEELTSTVTLSCRLSKIMLAGSATNISKLTNVRLLNTGAGQWGGTSFHIDISYTLMSTAAINQLFADMAAQGNVTSKTINITGATGAAGLTAGDRAVIISRGWTITG